MATSSPFPEIEAGGFSRRDGTIQFYSRVNALCGRGSTVVDVGAGRGEWLEDTVQYRRELRRLKGKVKEVIGVDIDPAVLTNPSCDRSLVMPDLATIPLADNSVDIVVADHTFEHVEDPTGLISEFSRILRPNGWVCARTPNRWGYVGIATNLVPNARHAKVLSRAQPDRQVQDIFPTAYRLNTRRAVSKNFGADRWDIVMYPHNPEPSYFGRSAKLAKFVDAVCLRLPSSMATTWSIFVQRRG